MKVIANIRIKHNGVRYKIGEELEIDIDEFDKLKDLVEVVESSEGELTPPSLDKETDNLNKDDQVDNVHNEEGLKEGIDLSNLSVKELRAMAKEKGIEGYSNLKKEELLGVL